MCWARVSVRSGFTMCAILVLNPAQSAPEIAAETAAGRAGGRPRDQQVAAGHRAVVADVRLRSHRPELPGAAHRQTLLARHRKPTGHGVSSCGIPGIPVHASEGMVGGVLVTRAALGDGHADQSPSPDDNVATRLY